MREDKLKVGEGVLLKEEELEALEFVVEILVSTAMLCVGG